MTFCLDGGIVFCADPGVTLLMPLATLILFATGILILGLILKKQDRALAAYYALSGILLSLIFTLTETILPRVSSSPRDLPATFFHGLIRVDGFSIFFMLVFLVVSALVVLTSYRYMNKDEHLVEYYSLILFATSGMILVSMANDLVIIFLGIEMASIPTYILAGFRKKEKKSIESAMKYFIIGAFSSAISIYGISLTYGIAGTTSFDHLSNLADAHREYESVLLIAIICLIAGLGFKIAAVPFHMWAPDVYEGSPTPVTAFLAAGSKKMGFAAIFKVFLVGLIAFRADWTLLFIIISILTMTTGNILALQQRNIKRMLAYSSIAQAGYILIALPIYGGTVESNTLIAEYAVAGGLFHILTHALMKGGAFIIVSACAVAYIGDDIEEYRGLAKREPLLAFSMMLFLLSLAGLPPLAGFASKFVLFSSAVYAGGPYIILAVAGVINSAISLYYYARVIRNMYILPPEKGKETHLVIPISMKIAICISACAVIFIGLYWSPFIELALDGAHALLP